MPRESLVDDEIRRLLFQVDSDEPGSSGESSDSDADDFELSLLGDQNIDKSVLDAAATELEQVGEVNENTTWNENVDGRKFQRKGFEGIPGPAHDLPTGAEAIDFFKLLFTTEMCEVIRKNTNAYAESKGKKDDWIPVNTVQEIWAYISIIIIMGLVKLPCLRDYWSENSILGNAKVKSIMSRKRFEEISRYFHLSDVSQDTVDKMSKLEPFFSELKENIQKSFLPYKEVSIDEALIKFKGRLGIVQYMPLKPAKRGIKLWMLRSFYLGYVHDFELYCGRDNTKEKSGKGLGYDVVMNFAKKLERKHHEIYFDRFFTSVPLIF